MPSVLHLETSARSAGSTTRRIAAELVDRLVQLEPGTQVVTRDLGTRPVPHIDEAFVAAMFVAADQRTPEDEEALALSEELIAEIEAASAIVIGAPMYNYGVPSALKAWIDHVVRARRTFRHTVDGPVGMLADKPVYVVTASGGIYGQGPGQAHDFLRPYLKDVLGKIGLKSLMFVAAEGQAVEGVGPERAIAGALASIDAATARRAA